MSLKICGLKHTWLSARQDLIEFCRRQSLSTYNRLILVFKALRYIHSAYASY